MAKLWKKFYQLFLNDELDMKERLFRVILVVGTITVSAAIVQGLTLVNAENLLFVYMMMLGCFIVAFFATFKYRNMDFASTLIGIMIIIVALPEIFFKGGGTNSGAPVWMTLGIFYVFLMFKGRKRTSFLIISLLAFFATYAVGFHFPEAVTELNTRFEVFFDSIFALFLVGLTGGVILDFELKVFEKEREVSDEQRKELELLSKSKDTFFASMSHEIRTPINSIVGLNELILREDPSPEIRVYAENIQNASRTLLSLVNDILDLSQLEIQKMRLVEQEYNTYDMFHEAVDVMQVRMNSKKLSFMVDIDNRLPAKLKGDSRRIVQVLLNLLSNAVKYTEEGSVTLTCSQEQIDDTHIKLIIAVADTGIGIRKEEIEYLFDAFTRVDAGKTNKIEGTGLGLAISKQLLDLMGGTISVDSIYTKGSLFTITIPQEVASHDPMGEFLSENKTANVGAYYSKAFEAPEARVLIVDDDDLNLIITTKLLQDTKMMIDTASSPEECLRKTKSRYYNLIFVDYLMPRMDGGELLHEIRRQDNGLCRETPVVLLSANAYGDKQQEYLDMGFNSVLEKPINAAKLEEEALKYIADDFIEYRRDKETIGQAESFVSRMMTKKRKRVYITTDSVSDLPQHMLERYDIRVINLYIKTKYGRFRDMEEIDINNVANYITDSESRAVSLSPRVDEYETFFSEVLTEADDVIYFSMASSCGRCYNNALEAAKSFGHVHVIDTSAISSGQGLIVLGAAKMAQDGMSCADIEKNIAKWRAKLVSSYMLPSVHIYGEKGFAGKFITRVGEFFKLHPVIGMINGKLGIHGVGSGRMEKAWRDYIHFYLRNKNRINDDVIFIMHAGLTVRQQEIFLDEVRRHVKFKTVIISHSSVSNICNAGLGSVGFAFFKK